MKLEVGIRRNYELGGMNDDGERRKYEGGGSN